LITVRDRKEKLRVRARNIFKHQPIDPLEHLC